MEYVAQVSSPCIREQIDGPTEPEPQWSERFEWRSRSPRSCRRGFRTLSAIHLVDTSKKARLAGHRRSVRRIRNGSESGGIGTRFDPNGYWTAIAKWNRGRSANSQACPGIQNNLLEWGMFC